MASSKEMVDYVCDQLSGAGEIRAKRMFGEWGLSYLYGYIRDLLVYAVKHPRKVILLLVITVLYFSGRTFVVGI